MKRFIKHYKTSQWTKVVHRAPDGLLQLNEGPDRPWKSIVMDLIRDLPKSEGYASDIILVIIDRVTKMKDFIQSSKNVEA